jgi:helix-turn-helix protein
MSVKVPASRLGLEVTLANADAAGRPDGTPLVAWPLVERRRPVVAPLTMAPELTALRGGGASPEGVLGSALVHALRQIVRGELDVRLTPAVSVQPSRWMTPPAASRLTRVPVKTIRAWARDGRIPKRLKNRSADPKQQKYLVNVDDVIAAAERVSAANATPGEQLNVRERAREILAARAAKGR